MKVLFLDIDGVLNTPKLIKTFGYDYIDPVLVAIVAKIVNETSAKIVLSSTWRKEEVNRRLVEEALAQHYLEIHDCTPVFDGWVDRCEEIREWLSDNEVSKFAILDDWEDAEVEGSFFLTDENRGLTVEIAERVIEHLGRV